jgi:hypothetical protein
MGPGGCSAPGPAGVRLYRHNVGTVSRVSKYAAIQRAAERLAGGPRVFRALPKAARDALRSRALELQRLARRVAGAARREASVVREGFVYAITNEAWPSRVKIGSAVDAESRLGDAQTWDPHRQFRVVHSVFVPDRNAAERRIHRRLHEYRLDGEWFAVSLTQAKAALEKERQALSA